MSGATKLLLTSGGSTTIQAVDSASANVLTLPARTGNIAVDGPAFCVSSSQTVATTSQVIAVLSNEQYDTANAFDSTTNYRFTAPVAGYYQINVHTYSSTASAAGGVVLTSIWKNGAMYDNNFSEYLNSNLTPLAANGSDLIYLAVNDYLDFRIFQTSGASQVIGLRVSGYLARAA